MEGDDDTKQITNWTVTQFLIFVIIVEHVMIIVKILIEQSISDTPKNVVAGEREKKHMIEKYENIKELGDAYRPVDVAKNMTKAKIELAAEGLINKIGLNLVE